MKDLNTPLIDMTLEPYRIVVICRWVFDVDTISKRIRPATCYPINNIILSYMGQIIRKMSLPYTGHIINVVTLIIDHIRT